MVGDSNFEKAVNFYDQNDYYQALKHILLCNQLRRRASLQKGRDHSNNLMDYIYSRIFEGRIYLKLNRIEDAQEVYHSTNSLIINTDPNANLMRGEILLFLKDIALAKDLKTESLEYLQQAKQYFELSEKFDQAIQILFEMEGYKEYQSDPDRLISLYNEIIELNKFVSDKSMRHEISAKTRLKTGVLLRNIDIKRASTNLIKAKKNFSKLELPKFEIQALFELADLKSETDLERSIDIIDEALKIAYSASIRLQSKLKKSNYSVLLGRFNSVLNLSGEIEEELSNVQVSNDIADLVLEISKSILLVSDNDELFRYGQKLSRIALEQFGVINNREGKFLAYLIEGLFQHQLDPSKENTRLKLIPVLANKIATTMLSTDISFNNRLIKFISSDSPANEIIQQTDHNFIGFNLYQKATILHLLGLYNLFRPGKSDDAKLLLEQSRELYEQVKHQNLNLQGIMRQIQDRITGIS